jgi:hypothetical protein
MRLRRVFLVGFLSLIVLVGIVGLASRYRERDDLARRIEDLVAQAIAQGRVVDFGQLDHFAWDALYIFTPYTSGETIDAALGFAWDGADATGIERRDDINLLVFTRDGAVVAYSAIPRSTLDFEQGAAGRAFTPDAAQFQVQQESGSQMVVLTPSAS